MLKLNKFIKTSSLLFFCLYPLNSNAQLFKNKKPQTDYSNAQISANKGNSYYIGLNSKEILQDRLNLSKSFSSIKPQENGKTEVFLIVAGLDTDPVFNNEASETYKLLSKRYNTNGHSILLGSGSEISKDTPIATLENLAASIEYISTIMNKEEDVLIIYTSSHGHFATGLRFKYYEKGIGNWGPEYYKSTLDNTGIKNKFIMISACYSGVFIPKLENDNSIIMTAAASDRSSFGCKPENKWTYFGNGLINQAMRKKNSAIESFKNAKNRISEIETKEKLTPSNPQISIGKNAEIWLKKIEANIPNDLGKPINN